VYNEMQKELTENELTKELAGMIFDGIRTGNWPWTDSPKVSELVTGKNDDTKIVKLNGAVEKFRVIIYSPRDKEEHRHTADGKTNAGEAALRLIASMEEGAWFKIERI
jgi:hypothetical protein